MRLTDEQIGTALTELRATPTESFASRLDQRAAAGFPAEQRDRKPERELTWIRLLPALGVLAAIAVVAVVISSNNEVQVDSRGGSDTEDVAAPSETAAPSLGPETQGDGAATSVPPTEQVPPGLAGRPRNGHPQVQERTASLGLATDADELQNAADGVIDVTDRYDGFVDSSAIHANGDRGRASFSLRIPTQHLNDALADFSDLGRVTRRDLGSTHVTGSYVDAGKAFREARAKVDGLLDDLAGATSESERASVQQQLVIAREQLVAARAALRGLKQRVALTPVSVEITAQGDGSWTIGDAADDAVGVLEAIAGAALITLAVLVPLAALILLGWLGARELSRRRREATLDR
jgi:hypothetical protein